jgi:hypothetical protein
VRCLSLTLPRLRRQPIAAGFAALQARLSETFTRTDQNRIRKFSTAPQQKLQTGRISVTAESTKELLDNRNVNPPQVFDFNPDALDKILGSMLYQNHPAEGGNHEEGKPEKDAKTNHFRTVNQCQCQCQQLSVASGSRRLAIPTETTASTLESRGLFWVRHEHCRE